MHTRSSAAMLPGILLLGLLGCEPSAQPKADNADHPAPLEPSAHLLQIAHQYQTYHQVDEQMRWALTDCRVPPPPELRVSASSDEATHGHKLYAVFARLSEHGSYLKPGQPSPVGQVIVKESWLPMEVKDDSEAVADPASTIPIHPGTRQVRYLPFARKDGHLYKAVRRAELFIMYKTDPQSPGADHGWVYGTVSADGQTVTAVGQIESCMKCHQAAPHDRLFGLPSKVQ